MAMTMVGTQTPQKLFTDIPENVKNVPGMVTPDITAAMPSNVDWADVINAQNTQKALRNAAWARSAAQQQAQQRQQQQAGEQEKMRAAFNEWWAPKLKTQSHDLAFALDNARGAQLRKQYGNTPGGYFASGRPYQEGKVPYQGVGEQQLQQQLDQMWRQQTDPYLRAVSGMDAATMFSLGTPGKGGNMPGRRSSGGQQQGDGGGRQSYGGTTQASEVNPFPTTSLTERTRPTVYY